MSIDVVTAPANGTSATAQVSSKNSTDVSKKTSSETSFEDEMEKISSTKEKDSTKIEEEKKDVKTTTNEKEIKNEETKVTDDKELDYSKFGSIALADANTLLANDIEQMIKSNSPKDVDTINPIQGKVSIFNGNNDQTRISMTENDANFFLDLTKNNEINFQNIALQAQNMINNGAEIAKVKQSAQISQTLLDAINKAKETNQPLRIDFDQNVSVILRISKGNTLAAHFIPSDKVAEQYLRNNISNLKATFVENDLPYEELSYSSSNNKEQNNRRRNKQQEQRGDK